MSENKLNTVISVSDKFSAGIIEFEKRLNHTLGPIGRLEDNLKRIDKFSGFKGLRAGFAGFRDNMSKTLQSVANIGAGIGIVTGAVGIFVAKINKIALMGDSLAKTSKYLGLSVESLQKFEFVAERSGVPVDAMQKSMQRLAVTAMRAAGGMKKESLAFNSLGIKAKKINGDVKSTEELLIELSDKFAYKSYTATEKLYIAQEIFGKQGASMVNLLNQGPEAIRAEMELVKKLGLMNETQAENSEYYANAVTEMKWAFRGLSVEIGSKAIPILTTATKKITEMFSDNKEKYVDSLNRIVEKIPQVADTILDNLPNLMKGISKIVSFVNWLVDKIGFVTPLVATLTATVIVPLTASIYHLIKILHSFVRIAKTAGHGMSFLKEKMFGSSKAVERLSASVQKSSSVVDNATKKTSKQLRRLKKEAQKTEKRMQKLALTNKQTASSFNVVGKSAMSAGSKIGKAGNSTLKMIGRMGGALMVLDSIGNSLENMTDPENSKYKNLSVPESVGRFFWDTLEDLPVLGGFAKAFENSVMGKVDFSNMPKDPLQNRVNEWASNRSDLFDMVSSTKTINNNNHSTIDVNFNGFPKGTEIKRHGYNDPSFGYSMSPAF